MTLRLNLWSLLAVALTVLAVACGEQPQDNDENDPATCEQDDDCEEGYRCGDQVCEEETNEGLNVNQTNNENDEDCPDDGCHPRLFTPGFIEFFDSSPGNDYSDVTFIENYGEEPLEIRDVRLEGDDQFDLTFPGKRPEQGGEPDAQNDDATFSAATLRPDEQLLVRVWFRPDDPQPREGEIIIESNSVDAGEHTVTLEGNHAAECLQLSPFQGVDFGPSPTGATTWETVRLRNCSLSRALTIHGISVSGDDHGVFDIPADAYPGDLPGDSLVLGPREETTVTLGYSPGEEMEHSAELVVSSTDAVESQRTIELTGEGIDADCPVAEIAVDVDGDDSSPLDVTPQQQIELSATGSSGGDGAEIDAYEWSVIDSPLASHPELDDFGFDPHNADPEPTFVPDVAGEFTVELSVVDANGVSSCENDIVEFHAQPDADVYVETAWHNLYVQAPELFEGTDVNLHYLHPDGGWNSEDWSVSSNHPEQSWDGGTATMISTDDWGENPETLTHDQPVDGYHYDVGIHYNHDSGFGPSDVTVSVFLQGQLVFQEIDRRIYEVGELWHVGYVNWSDDPEFVEIDQIVTDHPIPSEPPEGPS